MKDLKQSEAKALAKKGLEDPVWFLQFFLSSWFSKPLPWVHRGIVAILTRRVRFLERYGELDKITSNFLDEDGNPIFYRDAADQLCLRLSRFTLIMMPRGFSKTTLVNGVNIWKICYQMHRYVLYTSETAAHASTQLTNITRQLTTNARLLAVFGNPKPAQRGQGGLKWSESEGFIETTTGVVVRAIGRGGQARGQNVDAARPDCIIVDDVEDKESVATDAQRAKALEWFYGDLLPALPEMNKKASLTMMGTLLHPEALLQQVKSDPEFTVIEFGALDRQGEPLWPDMMSLEKIEARKQRYAMRGLLHLFYMEYFNQIRAPEQQKFRQEFIHVMPMPLEKIPLKAMAIDPAISTSASADFCALAVVGMSDDGVVQIVETLGRRGMSPREQIDAYFELHFRFKLTAADKHGVEAIAYQAALCHLLKEEMFRQGKVHGPSAYFEVIPIVHNTDVKKEARIEGVLQPRYASGYVRHQRHFPELETALLDWPNCKKDFPDAVAMAISLLDDAAPYAAGDQDLAADEYEPLGEWRAW